MTGDSFTRRRRFGQAGWRMGRPAPEYPAYADCYDTKEAYLAFLRRLIENAHKLLSRTGVLALHLDWHTSAYGRVICDEVFGEELFLNEVIWSYESGGRAKKYFSRKHDTILLYARTKDYHFDLRRVPLERTEHRKNHMRRRVDEDGRAYSEIKTGGKVYRYYDDAPVYPGDVWTDISHLQQRDPERTGYATQKPLKLLDRILKPVVKEGDLVIDLCCGSGTAMEAAQALRGKTIQLYREDIDEEVIFAAELIGMEVQCEGKTIGKIADVLDYPGNMVYVVRGQREYMIPAVSAFVLDTDMENNLMQVRLIEGMATDEN